MTIARVVTVGAAMAALALAGCPTGKSLRQRDGRHDQHPADVRVPSFDGQRADHGPDLDATTTDTAPSPDSTVDAGFTVIKLVATDAATDGNVGGVAGADLMCAKEAKAASEAGTWRALISSSAQNARDLIAGAKRALPVVNGRAEVLFNDFDEVFRRVIWRNAARMYTFTGRQIDNNGPWFDGDAWHGSHRDGRVWAVFTCSDWTSASRDKLGVAGELDDRDLLRQDLDRCSERLAIVCVRMP